MASTKQDAEMDKEVIREHLRNIMNDMELSPKDRISAMQLLGKDAGMWPTAVADGGAVSLQVLIADMRSAVPAGRAAPLPTLAPPPAPPPAPDLRGLPGLPGLPDA